LPFLEDLSKFPTAGIIIWTLALFLSFGLISNFTDNEGVIYNLLQGVFISVVAGGVLYFARYLSRRRIANRVKLQPMPPKDVQI
jgi:hypothetical protein